MMEKVTLKEQVSYGLGDLACNTLFTMVSSYMMFFYTDIAGIGLVSVGVISLVARIIDAITDPMMGSVVDRTKTKWGKARPYVKWMAAPMAITAVLMFAVPDAGTSVKYAYAMVTYILFCLAYTGLNIPYSVMMSNMTDKNEERLGFNMFKTIGSNVGAFLANGLTLTLVAVFGSKVQKHGFMGAAAVYGVFAVVLLLICFKNTKERVVPLKDKVSIKESLAAGVKNTPWLITLGLSFCYFLGLLISNQGAVYYAKYYLEDAAFSAKLMSIPSLMAIPVAFLVPAVAKRLGYKYCVVAGNVVWMASLLGIYLSGKNTSMILVCVVIGAVGSKLASGVSFLMSAQTVDYAEWMTGVRPAGFFMAAGGFVVKLSMAASSMIIAFVLQLGGYVQNASQSQESLNAIRFTYMGVPMVIAGVAVVLALFYSLDKKYPQIVKELRERREKTNTEKKEEK